MEVERFSQSQDWSQTTTVILGQLVGYCCRSNLHDEVNRHPEIRLVEDYR